MDVSFSAFSHPDARLTLLGVVLAVMASTVALGIFHYAGRNTAARRTVWLLVAAVCGASGMWAAHLVGVLAHTLDIGVHFDVLLALVALASVALLMLAGFFIAARGRSWHAPIGGAINGTGFGLMQYVGLYSLAIPGSIEWDVPLVMLSLVFSTGLSSAALTLFQRLKGPVALWCGTALLSAAFIGLHFTAMHAAHLTLDPSTTIAAGASPHAMIAVVVAITVLIVLTLGIAATLIDRRSHKENVQFMQDLVDAAIEGLVVVKDGRIASVNRGVADLSGFDLHELLGQSVSDGLLDQPIEEGASKEALMQTARGDPVPVKVVRRRIGPESEVYTVRDLTEQRAAEAELQRQNKALQEREEELRVRNLQLHTALTHMSQGLCMYDKDERVVVCNDRYATVYGLPSGTVRPGMTRQEILDMRIAQGVWAGASPEEYREARMVPVTTADGYRQELNDGRIISSLRVPMPGGGWVCTHEDVTEQHRAQARIEHIARHHGLTDLPNRVLLREKLQEALVHMRERGGVAVHCIDLDRFKEVNDALGPRVGDELLQVFAARLRHIIRKTDTLAHVGGDEFTVVQQGVVSPSDATGFAAKVIASLNEPFVLGDHFRVVLGVSIGIALAPRDGETVDELLKNANLAVHRAKREERGSYRFFEQEMDTRIRARHELECNLRGALANGEFSLVYQPLLNLRRNKISSFEALMRWQTANGEQIPPSEFIPIAEETGLILPIGEWALREALNEAAKWPQHLRVAVNLSPAQFSAKNLAQVVMGALAASGVAPDRLEIEITESLLMQEREVTLATLQKLRDLGVRIALDDFGTGFSSLSYLQSFPFDKLKIDRCFVAGLGEGNEESLAIVRAVARLGQSLGISTTAEGVETQDQMNVARMEGITEAQGYLVGRPQSAADIAQTYNLYRGSRKPRRRKNGVAVSAVPDAAEHVNGHDQRPKAERGVSRAARANRA